MGTYGWETESVIDNYWGDPVPRKHGNLYVILISWVYRCYRILMLD